MNTNTQAPQSAGDSPNYQPASAPPFKAVTGTGSENPADVFTFEPVETSSLKSVAAPEDTRKLEAPSHGSACVPTPLPHVVLPGGLRLPAAVLFRCVLLACVTLFLAAGVANVLSTLPAPLQNALSDPALSLNYNAWQTGFSLGLLLLFVALYSGLWTFKAWARLPYALLGMVISVFPTPLEAVVMSGWEYLFNTWGMLLDGIMIALMFLPPVDSLFRKSKI